MGDALVLHNRLYIRKVQIDNRGDIDQIRDALYGLLQHFIRFLKGLGHGGSAVHDLQQLVVGNDDQGVHIVLDLVDTGQCIGHPGLCLKAEGLGHHTHGQHSHFLGQPGHHGSRAGTRTASHTTGDKYHVRPCQSGSDLFGTLLGSLLTHFRLGAGAQPLGQFLTDLQQLGSLAQLQGLLVRIYTDKFHSVNLFVNHSINSIIACTTHTYNDDSGGGFCVVSLNFQQRFVLLLSRINSI